MRRTSACLTVLFAVLALTLGTLGSPSAQADEVPANSGLPGSACVAAPLGRIYTAPGAGVTTTGLGADAPAHYEIGRPTGAFQGKTPKGVMLVIHGGGWYVVGKDSVSAIRSYADSWRARGWQTINIDYRACKQSIGDVVWFANRVHQIAPAIPMCAAGISAGGHLALLLASIRSDVRCVVSIAGPSDLTSLSVAQPKLAGLAAAAFGADLLFASSPIRYVRNIKARVLLISGAADRSVPPAQNDSYAAALRSAQPGADVEVHLLEYGDQPFVHTGISLDAKAEWRAAEDALVAPVARAA
ncbi:MAG: prolyl oligopeptidase family serine peptidase [Acidimicrobiales bacterium]|nr:prolyl oligopeptidase family serine peptidase [Acidimicrobiales bacterium]